MRTQKPVLKFAVGCAIAAVLSSCGAQQFQSIATTQRAAAPGSLQIKPKVDVVLVEDDTGRIQDNYANIDADAKGFLSSLGSQGWNYHFATLRLTTPTSVTNPSTGTISQATSSTEDPNWGSQWTAAYPGEAMGGYGSNEDALNPNIFSTINYEPPFAQYNGFLQPGQATNVLQGSEPGFYTMAQDFANSFNNTGFFRPDALLAVVLVGTGNDTSYVNYCWNGNEVFPCDQVLPANQQCTNIFTQSTVDGQTYPQKNPPAECASGTASFNYFLSQIKSVKAGKTQQIKFYSATASINSAASHNLLCAGGYATPGTRYQQMATALGGQSYDVCSQPLSSILSSVSQSLTTTALDYVQGYLLLDTATQECTGGNPSACMPPNVSTIQVTKYVGGDPNNAVVIPQDPNNGWTYAGYLTDQPTIIEPVPMNYESGFMLQLNGAAQLSGADYATVTYKMENGTSGN